MIVRLIFARKEVALGICVLTVDSNGNDFGQSPAIRSDEGWYSVKRVDLDVVC